MKFNVKTPDARDAYSSPSVGDVYRAKGGRAPRLHVIVGQSEKFSYYLSLDSEGQICGAGNYYTTVFEDRRRIGFVDGLEAMEFDVNWEV